MHQGWKLGTQFYKIKSIYPSSINLHPQGKLQDPYRRIKGTVIFIFLRNYFNRISTHFLFLSQALPFQNERENYQALQKYLKGKNLGLELVITGAFSSYFPLLSMFCEFKS